jgi:predicted PurR-regulated permease PerM
MSEFMVFVMTFAVVVLILLLFVVAGLVRHIEKLIKDVNKLKAERVAHIRFKGDNQ